MIDKNELFWYLKSIMGERRSEPIYILMDMIEHVDEMVEEGDNLIFIKTTKGTDTKYEIWITVTFNSPDIRRRFMNKEIDELEQLINNDLIRITADIYILDIMDWIRFNIDDAMSWS